MNRSNILYVALATMTLATSCAQDELQSSQAAQNEINFNASMGLRTRATETTATTLTEFKVSAYNSNSDANYMTDVTYTKKDDAWNSPENETYFWPASTDYTLNFYAYAPTSNIGTVTINKTTQQIASFAPGTTSGAATQSGSVTADLSDADAQVDLIYAVTPGQTYTSNSGKVDLTFNHALSEISVQAKNDNSAYTVVVSGVQIGGVAGTGTYTLPTTATATNKGSWDLTASSSTTSTYTTNITKNPVTLGSTAKYVDGSTNDASNNTFKSFMLLPQNLSSKKQTKYISGSYIALKVTITMAAGDVPVKDKWIYVGIDTNWEEGKHYTYVIDFTKGAGQDENGAPVLGSEIIINQVSITDWDKTSNGTTLTYTDTGAANGQTVQKNGDD